MIITSEQVGKGHPDKVCDQVSDFILTKIIKNDKEARVAVECAAGKGKIFITGEVKTLFDYKNNLENEVRELLVSIDEDYRDFVIELNISEQSPEINSKVDGEELGAGDQGLMYGYATNETKVYLPIPYALSTKLIKDYELKFASKNIGYKFDSKAQASFDYSTMKFVNINISVQHSKDKTIEEIREELYPFIIETVKEFEEQNELKDLISNETEITINNGGTFIMGGAIADAGLTGRKIIADSYGGWGRHGGGAFSGKDYTKVDRSAAYYGRYVARKIVENGYADICEIQVSYIIGRPAPIAINIETFETNTKSIEEISRYIDDNFDFRLQNIVEELDLKNLDYTKTTLYGHFGKDELKWK